MNASIETMEIRWMQSIGRALGTYNWKDDNGVTHTIDASNSLQWQCRKSTKEQQTSEPVK